MNVLGIFTVDPNSFSIWTLRISMTLTTAIFTLGLLYVILGFWYARWGYRNRLAYEKSKPPSSDDTFAETVVKILWSTAQSEMNEGPPTPKIFLDDATRQVAENIFNGKYLDRISMCANLLPPIGLWGTVSGMIVIFLYTGDPGAAINKGALGTKLWSTFLALIYYVTLEGLYMVLTNRIRRCIDDALSVKL
jgi:biopolymer transport protein ExbB/TolQ